MFNLLKKLVFFAIYVVCSMTVANALEPLYKAKGENVVIDPKYSGPPITNMEWKHGSNIAAEIYEGTPECLGQFKGRCTLDPLTGALTITGLYMNESGIFTVTINEAQMDLKISLSVMSKVPKPSISLQWNPDKTSCTLTCDGDTTDAEPVSYMWFGGEAERGSGKVLEITKETEDESFTCRLQNQVSKQSSESFPNPFIKNKTNLAAIIVPILIFIGLIALIALIGFVYYKWRKGSCNFDWVPKRFHRVPRQDKNQGTSLNGISKSNPQQPNTIDDSEVRVNIDPVAAPAVTQNSVARSDSGAQRDPVQVQASVKPQNDDKISEETPLMLETADQDPARTELPGTSEETADSEAQRDPIQVQVHIEPQNAGNSYVNTSGAGETPGLDLTVPESVNTSEETENAAPTSKNHESTNHEPTLVEEEAGGEGDGD